VPTWSEITSKPSSFTPSAHTHDDRYFRGGVENSIGKLHVRQSSDSYTQGFTLGNASNTSKVYYWVDGNNYRFSYEEYGNPYSILTLSKSDVIAHKVLTVPNPTMDFHALNRGYADARYKSSSYVPSWSEITSKPSSS